jgi:lambda family phage portal protein
MFGWFKSKAPAAPDIPVIDIDSLGAYEPVTSGTPDWFTGDKFLGSFGETKLFELDYWGLRARSRQLFIENLYARGMIRRLITNEINTGLVVEASPVEQFLSLDAEQLEDWSDITETAFELYASDAQMVDATGECNLGKLQKLIRMMALVEGDILTIIDIDAVTQLPRVRLISGNSIRTPPRFMMDRMVQHGVRTDKHGRHVAYYVEQRDGTFITVRAYGKKSGRRIAKLIYGTDKLKDDIRGEPLLSIVLSSLKELDRYRDSTQRKATINSILAMFIKKTQDKPGTKPMSGAATKHSSVETLDDNNSGRTLDIQNHIPGVVMQELQTGEEPVAFNSASVDLNYQTFESAVIDAIAWANEIPPTIMKLAFSSNYSASQGEINEFKVYLTRVRKDFADDFLNWLYSEWLLGMVLNGVLVAPGFIHAWQNYPNTHMEYNAWVHCEWLGAIKPSADVVKSAKGYKILHDEGFITGDHASRELTGTKYSRNLRRQKRELEKRIESIMPAIELLKTHGINLIPNSTITSMSESTETEPANVDD